MELPRLKALYEKFKDRGFQIVALEHTRDTANARQFIRQYSLPYRFVENGEGKEELVRSMFGINSFPTSYLIDSKGRIVRVHVGFEEGDEKEYENQVFDLLNAS